MKVAKRIVMQKVLPGEPLDGSGRVCIHLFVPDDAGPFVEPSVMHVDKSQVSEKNPQGLVSKPTRGRLACDSNRKVEPVTRGNVTTVTMRTDDTRAVTCRKCIASPDYTKLKRE